MGGTADAEPKSVAIPTRRPAPLRVDARLGSHMPPIPWCFRTDASLFGCLRYGSCRAACAPRSLSPAFSTIQVTWMNSRISARTE